MKEIYNFILIIILLFTIIFYSKQVEKFNTNTICQTQQDFNIHGFTEIKNNKLVLNIYYETNNYVGYLINQINPTPDRIKLKHFIVINSLNSKMNKIISITHNKNNWSDNENIITDITGDNQYGNKPVPLVYKNLYTIDDYIVPNELYNVYVILTYIDEDNTIEDINNKIIFSKTLTIFTNIPEKINNRYDIIEYNEPNNLINKLKGKKFNINIK